MSLTYANGVKDSSLNNVTKEKPSLYTKHDQLFKQLIEVFFKEFIEAFFPEIHEQINLQRITFLSEEMFTDVYDGKKKVLDLAVEVKWKETDVLIVVHVVPQNCKQAEFNDRIFSYFCYLYNKVAKPIIPIAVFNYEEALEISEFSMKFNRFQVLHFNYLSLHLWKQNWRTFTKKDNPLAGALLSKMDYADDERVQVKLAFFQILAQLKLDDEKNDLLIGFFETYLKLSTEEEAILVKEASKLDNAEEIINIPISYEERGKKIGREEGRIEERKTIALNMLRKGLSIALIMEMTMLTLEEIEKLKVRL